ncbi:hypothetical protein N7509_001486 [Penicillium cosmopolitanum]|uniref:Uncharacterized protein n=1 Tax=Penicillium cosmopolitanum TaxID=1131564 RepID=A0A9W9W7D4_9EURO|nr:uncharacterized protein N7509_001486 [Penicillium cosmopolitanum]KAJ5407603.1 hypothetical protein N7509_001486 [Penicillium cosmopolitanum]
MARVVRIPGGLAFCPNCANCLYTKPTDPADPDRIGERLTCYCYTCPYQCPVSWLMERHENGQTQEDSDSDSDDTDVGVKVESEEGGSDKAANDKVEDHAKDAAVEDAAVEDAAVEEDDAGYSPTSMIPSDGTDGASDSLVLNAEQLEFVNALTDAISQL